MEASFFDGFILYLDIPQPYPVGPGGLVVRYDWAFQTGRFAPGITRNDRGTACPCLLAPLAVKSKPPAGRVVVGSSLHKTRFKYESVSKSLFCRQKAGAKTRNNFSLSTHLDDFQ
jgi:hypothetical protein